MYNSQEIVLNGKTGSYNIMGNSNSIQIVGSRVHLNITGNSNMIMIMGSQVKIQVVGNNNQLECNESQVGISLIGNFNQVRSSASQLNFSGVMGSGNQIPNVREDRRREESSRARQQQRRRRQSAERQPDMPQQMGTYAIPALPFMYSAMNQLSNLFGFGGPSVPQHQPQQQPRRNRIFAYQEQHHGDNVSRRIFRMGSDNEQQDEQEGLDHSELNLLPKTKNNGSKVVNCSVCMQNIRHGQFQTYLFCFHNFHSQCIERWLAKKRQCPVCQLNVREHLANQ